jgi:hypothetical protein
LCSSGQTQSPIDLPAPVAGTGVALVFDYQPEPMQLLNNGRTIEPVEDHSCTVTADGKSFLLRQFHFHAPSEHTVDGEHSAMEMHLVHSATDGSVAVVGVLIQAGAHNANFDALWSNLPEAGDEVPGETLVDAAALLPADRAYWNYQGSSPPAPKTSRGTCSTPPSSWLRPKSTPSVSGSTTTTAPFSRSTDGRLRAASPPHGSSASSSGSKVWSRSVRTFHKILSVPSAIRRIQNPAMTRMSQR